MRCTLLYLTFLFAVGGACGERPGCGKCGMKRKDGETRAAEMINGRREEEREEKRRRKCSRWAERLELIRKTQEQTADQEENRNQGRNGRKEGMV